MNCFINYNSTCEFPIENLPYGVFSTTDNIEHRIGVAISDLILDLKGISNLFSNNQLGNAFRQSTLNEFMSLGEDLWIEARSVLQDLLSGKNTTLKNNSDLQQRVLIKQENAFMQIPAKIGNYTDFYSSLYHAKNVGTMFRGPENALFPNWRQLPVAYHGRASSIVISGTNIKRPCGQIQNLDGSVQLEATKKLDFELEMAFFIGGPKTEIGQTISIDQANKRIFGFVLMNDWSARDIQKWEYIPLGPFTAKNFGTTISPWIVTTLALQAFLVDNTIQIPKPLPYLLHNDQFNFDIELQVDVSVEKENVSKTVCHSNYKFLYWTAKQQLVHHTITGCNIEPGDLMASGTISGEDEHSFGSLLELTWNGSKPIALSESIKRMYLEDGDNVRMKGCCSKRNLKIGFGICEGIVIPADNN